MNVVMCPEHCEHMHVQDNEVLHFLQINIKLICMYICQISTRCSSTTSHDTNLGRSSFNVSCIRASLGLCRG